MELLIARQPRPRVAAALPAAAAAGRRNGVPHLGDLAAHQSAVLPSDARRGMARRARDRRARAAAVLRDAAAPRSTWCWTGPGRTAPSWCSPPPAAATWCSGSRRAPASRPARTCAPRPPAPPGSPSWRSWSTPTSNTPTGSPASRSAPCKRALPCGDYGHHRRRAARRRRGTQVAARPGRQPHQRQAALRPGRAGRPAPRRGGGRGPLLGDLQTRPSPPRQVADGLAELQVRWPNVPIVFCETRPLAEEWTYRFLAAAHHLGRDRDRLAAAHRPARYLATTDLDEAPDAPEPSTAEVRAWARANGIPVPDRGRLRPESATPGEPPTTGE